jgi:pyruvate dehydrogenase E2 component (dihydrolipoyllysine-residue acetyltransferase)
MPIDVTMPKLSDTMEEGKILKWLKHPGDRIAIGDILAEVETDKANMELEAFDEGVLSEVRIEEGGSAPVGAVIAVLAEPGEAKTGGEKKPARAKPPAATEPAPEARPAAKPKDDTSREPWRPTVVRRPEAPAEASETGNDDHVRASPLARKIARERGIDLRAVAGSGPGGRVVERDVEAAAARRGPPPAKSAPTGDARAAPPRVELSRVRRTTAKRMGEAKREIPHFYASTDIRMDEAVRLKDALVALEAEYAGLTYTHLLLKAAGLALRRVPEMNASYDGDAMILHEDVNVGMATATDDGLVVPVVKHCDREPLAGIVRQARTLLDHARSGRFAGDDLSGGTFTLSNLGMYPVTDFAAVVNPPQAAILAVGTIREVPVVHDGRIVAGRLMSVTLSCDHRIIDGVLAGRFLRELKGLLENPLALVL